eukprot:TRINITY_DN89166_c0_g1_i1.p2 TRINITY_DN89166_c0_g1~~TRINITY_DN89166_c0_g1_i1.p2  ORF type:complete len:138 (-),score=19.21 TRINITY_DN89166_c0_g1_i1:103-516(-)
MASRWKQPAAGPIHLQTLPFQVQDPCDARSAAHPRWHSHVGTLTALPPCAPMVGSLPGAPTHLSGHPKALMFFALASASLSHHGFRPAVLVRSSSSKALLQRCDLLCSTPGRARTFAGCRGGKCKCNRLSVCKAEIK